LGDRGSADAEQAACLWAGVDPALPWRALPDLHARVAPFFQLLENVVREQMSASAAVSTEDTARIPLSRAQLRAFAAKRNLRPAFLFDTVPPAVTDTLSAPAEAEDGKSRGGRPPQHDWKLMLGEVLRLAHDDGLPDKQATLERKLLDWFGRHWGKEPSASNVKKRVSVLYGLWRRAKAMTDGNRGA
jgi:hypothetical protein